MFYNNVLIKTVCNLAKVRFITRAYVLQKYKRKLAFTLAEVLITLLIIGIVASLVIPALIADTQQAEFKAAWKKNYAEIANATKLININSGVSSFKNLCGNGDDDCLRNQFTQYLSTNRICTVGQTYGNCWHKMDGSSKFLDNWPITAWPETAGAILNNGSLVIFGEYHSDCSDHYGSIYVCSEIKVDVNGFKKPNTIGKDIFALWVTPNSVVPFGALDDGFKDTCLNESSGWGCAATYLAQ